MLLISNNFTELIINVSKMLIKNGFFSKTSTKNSFISIVKIILQAENTEKYGLSIYYTYFFTLKNIGACMLYYVIIYT